MNELETTITVLKGGTDGKNTMKRFKLEIDPSIKFIVRLAIDVYSLTDVPLGRVALDEWLDLPGPFSIDDHITAFKVRELVSGGRITEIKQPFVILTTGKPMDTNPPPRVFLIETLLSKDFVALVEHQEK